MNMRVKLFLISAKWIARHKLWVLLCGASFSAVALLLGIGFSVKAGNENQISSYSKVIYISVENARGYMTLDEVLNVEENVVPKKMYLNSRGGIKLDSINGIKIDGLVGFNYITTEKDIEEKFVETEMLLLSQIDFYNNLNEILQVDVEMPDGEKNTFPARPSWRKEGDACIFLNIPWQEYIEGNYLITQIDLIFETGKKKEEAIACLIDRGYMIKGASDSLSDDEKIAKAVRIASAIASLLLYVLSGVELYVIVSSIISENRSFLLILRMLGIPEKDYGLLIFFMSTLLSISGSAVGCLVLLGFKGMLPMVVKVIVGNLVDDFGGRFTISYKEVCFILATSSFTALLSSIILTVRESVNFEKVK